MSPFRATTPLRNCRRSSQPNKRCDDGRVEQQAEFDNEAARSDAKASIAVITDIAKRSVQVAVG